MKERSRCRAVDRPGREECRDEFGEREPHERIGYENAESTDRFSSVALSCHREIVPEVILYIIMFIATINIILVRFINRLTLITVVPTPIVHLPSHQ